MNRWRLLAIGAMATTVLTLAGCGTSASSAPTATPTSTTSTPTATATTSVACTHGSPIYMVQPYAPAAALTAAYKPLIASLSKTLGCPVQFQIATSIQAEIAAARSGHVAIAEFAGLGSGFALGGAHPAITVAATYESDFNGTPAAFISAIYDDPRFGDVDLAGLATKRLALSTPGSLSGDYFPRAALSEAGVLGQVRTVYSGSHLQALRNLTCPVRPTLHRHSCTKLNAASLNSRVMIPAAKSHEWDPGKYTQIWHSDPIPYTAIGISIKMPDTVRKDLEKALLAVPVGNIRSIAQLIGFAPGTTGTGLVAISNGNYCQSASLDLCDVIKTLKLTPAQVRPMDREGL